jgi:hypothetical protein
MPVTSSQMLSLKIWLPWHPVIIHLLPQGSASEILYSWEFWILAIAGKWRFFNSFIPFDECARPGVFDLHTIECSGARYIKNNLFTKHYQWKDPSRGKHSSSPWGATIFLLANWTLTKKGERKMATYSACKKISGKGWRRFQVSWRSLQGHGYTNCMIINAMNVSPESFNFNISEKPEQTKK